jgi:hypothetical protein
MDVLYAPPGATVHASQTDPRTRTRWSIPSEPNHMAASSPCRLPQPLPGDKPLTDQWSGADMDAPQIGRVPRADSDLGGCLMYGLR